MDRFVKVLSSITILAMALIAFITLAFITLALATTAFINHLTMPESITNWLSIIVNACVGFALFFVGWKTHKVTKYQAREETRKEIRENCKELNRACEKEARQIKSSNLVKASCPTEGFLENFYNLKADSMLLDTKAIHSHFQYIENLIEDIKATQTKYKNFIHEQEKKYGKEQHWGHTRSLHKQYYDNQKEEIITQEGKEEDQHVMYKYYKSAERFKNKIRADHIPVFKQYLK